MQIILNKFHLFIFADLSDSELALIVDCALCVLKIKKKKITRQVNKNSKPVVSIFVRLLPTDALHIAPR